MVHRLLLLLATLLVPSGAAAQDGRSRTTQVWIDPALRVERPIELAEMAIDVRLQGFVATTRVDLLFRNPNDRVLEGELVFPLAGGQTLTGYALEVDGALREGVVVPKETARVAYESTVRQGIDPGLAELTRGNVFRTRLYPIPARGTKRVVVQFDQALADTGTSWRYVLPLQLADRVARFRVRAESWHGERPVAAGPAGTLTFGAWRDGFLAELERTDFRPERELRFDVPKPSRAIATYAVADVLEPAWKTFAAQVAAPPPAQRAPFAPKRVAVFWDASGSAAARDRARETAFLGAMLGKYGDVDVELVPFRDALDGGRLFAVRGGDVAALVAAIDGLAIDGGSSYGAVRLDAVTRPDVVVIVGDGLSNFGGHEPDLAAPGGASPRVLLVHAAQSADSARLARIARRHGGQVVDLVQTDAAAALRQADVPRWMLLGTKVVGGECTALAPAAPAPVGASFALYGRCRGPAVVELEIGSGHGKPRIERVAVGDAALLDPERGRFVQRLWATARIADLDAAPRPDDAAITALATAHGVVTRTTSLLVLDRIEDYVRWRVEPREPDLVAQYRALVAQQPKVATDERAADAQRIERVLAQWREFKAYHDTRHPWLESLLEPMARLEAGRWQALAGRDASGKGGTEALRLLDRATDLQRRWSTEGADDATRVAWEAEAKQVALLLDGLRQRRLALAPDSDAYTGHVVEARRTSAQRDGERRRELAEPAVAEAVTTETTTAMDAAPPAAPPAPPRPAPEAGASAAPMLRSLAGNAKDAKEDDGSASAAGGGAPVRADIVLGEWNPDTPYLAKLRASREPYAAYLAERRVQGTTPAFFLDCADWFRREAKNDALALRILSNLAELDVDNVPLMRVLAYRLQQWERHDLAVPQFEEALVLRGEEPQGRRDLALALARQARPDHARAIALLWEVVSREWDGRFPEIQLIALHELADLLHRAPAAERAEHAQLEHVPVGLRVVLTWDADNTDVDLWVVDPAGDTAIYSQPRTRTGGHMSRDFTGGYGPEVFTIRRPLPGTYVVKAHFFGDRRQTLTGAATLQVDFQTQFDSGRGERQSTTRRLEGDEATIEVGRFTVR